jgi:ATP-binding cassette subfamily F protein 3
VLTDALLDFPGTIIFISHDPVFLTRMATRVVEIEAGRALDYPGDYAYYLWKQEQELEAEAETDAEENRRNGHPPARTRVSKPGPQEPDRRELVKGLDRAERRVTDLEATIAKFEQRIRVRDQELKRQDLYQDHERWHALHLERQQWDAELERLLEEWTRHSAAIDELRRQIATMTPQSGPEYPS